MQFRISQKLSLLTCTIFECFKCSFSVTLGADLTPACITVLVCKTLVPYGVNHSTSLMELKYVKCLGKDQAHNKHSINASFYFI